MYKIFNNENAGVDNGVVFTLMFFVISLVFSATVITWLLFQVYGVSISGVSLAVLTGEQNQNFKTNAYTSDVIQIDGSWFYREGIGLEAQNSDSYLILDSLVPHDDGSYTNIYKINNTNNVEYSIVLHYSQNYVEEILVHEDGFYYTVKDNTVFSSEPYYVFFPYAGAKDVQFVTIVTTNDEFGSLSMTFNDVNVLNMNANEKKSPLLLLFDKEYFGGIGAKTSGLVIESFNAQNTQSTEGWASFINQGLAFISALFQIVVWNIDSQYLPTEINLIFIKTQLFAIVACAIVIIRG